MRNDNDDINLVTVAALSVRYKGQQFVIKALSELMRQGIKNIHYYLIGYGSKTYLEKLAIKYPNINFIGVEKYESVLCRALEKLEDKSLTKEERASLERDLSSIIIKLARFK